MLSHSQEIKSAEAHARRNRLGFCAMGELRARLPTDYSTTGAPVRSSQREYRILEVGLVDFEGELALVARANEDSAGQQPVGVLPCVLADIRQ